MAGIFLNYRRGPQTVTVGALAERLAHYFGADQIFVDHQMTPGTEYPAELEARLLGSDVLVAVIHDGWTDEFTRPRPKDWVRFEIAIALTNKIPIVPVLLEEADAPQRHELPENIGKLTLRQMTRVQGATFGADVERLVLELERHVAPVHIPPPEPAAPAKPKQVGRRIIAWAAGLFLVTPILFFLDSTLRDWEWLVLSAFASTVVLVALSTLTILLVPFVKRLTYRWDVEAGSMSLREATRKRWLVIALGILPFAYLLSKFGPRDDGAWQEWEVWYLIVICVVGAYFVHRTWRRSEERDYTWPPPVSTEPAVFRRAAYRLHEKLTTDSEWRGSRPRALQREAVSVYLSLAEVRLALRSRAMMTLTRWIRAGHVGEIAIYLGWLTSIVTLDAIALALLAFAGSTKLGAYLVISLTVAMAVVFTTAKTVVEFYADRREVTKWIDELTEWQTRLGPLVFEKIR
jgi:hypothetical protein